MNKAEEYLNERIDLLSKKRTALLSKINEADLEIKENEYRIKDLKRNVDVSFEVFSPRTKKNDFIKNEIRDLENDIVDLKALRDEYDEKSGKILKDINNIKNILRESELSDTIYDEPEKIEDICEAINNEAVISENNNNMPNKKLEIIIEEEKRFLLAAKIEEITLQKISNLIYKCEICGRVFQIDPGRAKLEIEVMSKTLNELYNNIQQIIDELKKTHTINSDSNKNNLENNISVDKQSVKKISVKKLSMEKLSKKGNYEK